MLGFRKKEHWGNRLAEVPWKINGIFGNPYDLVVARPQAVSAEVLSERIFIPEKFLRKGLIDDRHAPRSRRVLFGDTASSKDRVSDHVEVSGGNSIQRG